MTPLVEIGLSNALMAALLALIVVVVARVVRRPAVTHALWVLVLLKLVAAPMLGVPVGFEVDLASNESAEPLVASIPATSKVTSTPDRTTATRGDTARARALPAAAAPRSQPSPRAARVSAARPERNVVPSKRERRRPEGSATPSNAGGTGDVEIAAIGDANDPEAGTSSGWALPPLTIVSVITTVWVTGTVLVVLLQFWVVGRCSKWLERGGRATEGLQQEAEEVAATLGIGRCPRVWIVSTAIPPMLHALGPFARIVLPSPLLREVDGTTRRLLLAHELAHYHRGDHWVRMLEMLAVALFWWHPVVWWARREIHDSEEACCDALVVDRVSRAPRPYAEALLDTIDFLSRSAATVPVASGLGSADSIRKRLTDIMHRNVAASIDARSRWVILLAALVVLPLSPAGFAASSSIEASLRSLEAPGPIGVTASTVDARRPAVPVRRGERGSFADLLGLPPKPVVPRIWGVISSPDGSATISATTDRRVTLRDESTGTEHDLSAEHVTAVAFPAGDATLVTAHRDGRLQSRHAGNGDPIATVEAHDAVVRSLAIGPADRVVSGAADGTLRVWHLDAGAFVPVGSVVDLGRPVNCVRFSRDGSSLVVGLGDWRTPDTGRLVVLAMSNEGAVDEEPTTSIEFESSVAAVWFEDPARLHVAEWDGMVSIVDEFTGDVLDVGRSSKDAIAAMSFSEVAEVPVVEPLPEPVPTFDDTPFIWYGTTLPAPVE